MLNSILEFIANHPFIVLFSCLFTMAVMAYIGAHIRRYENAYEIPHVFSNAIILVILVYGCAIIYGVSQTHVETVKAPAYKDLDMTQTFVSSTQPTMTDVSSTSGHVATCISLPVTPFKHKTKTHGLNPWAFSLL